MSKIEKFPDLARHLSLRLAQDEADLLAAQKLRWRVFYDELGAQAGTEIPSGLADESLNFVTREADADHCLVATPYERLVLLPADRSLRDLDRYLIETGKRKRLGDTGMPILFRNDDRAADLVRAARAPCVRHPTR